MFLALAPFVAGAGETHTLTVVCSNGRPGVGQAALALFSSEEDFLKEPVAARTRSLDQSGEAVFALEGLAPGDYAVSVFYDEDGDGKLDTNFLGIPKELVGFSNNAKGRFGPPSFEQCKFELKDDKVIEIRLGKAKR